MISRWLDLESVRRSVSYNPDGTDLTGITPVFANGNCDGGSTVELNTVAIPSAGTYTALIGDCSDTNSGTYNIYLQRTIDPALSVSLVFGSVQTGMIAAPSGSNTFTFSASAGDYINFTLAGSGISPKIRVYNPDGTGLAGATPVFANGNCNGGSTIELNTLAIPSTGTYTVLVGDCSDVNTGNYSIYSQRTNNPAAPVSLIFGQVASGTISSQTQSNTYTFGARANDVINFTAVTTKGSLSPKLRLYSPSGTADSPPRRTGVCKRKLRWGYTVEMNSITLPTDRHLHPSDRRLLRR